MCKVWSHFVFKESVCVVCMRERERESLQDFARINVGYVCLNLKKSGYIYWKGQEVLSSFPFFQFYWDIILYTFKGYIIMNESESRSVVSNSLWPHGVCSPWNSPGQNTGVGSHFFLQGSSQPRDRTQVSCTAGRLFTIWATKEILKISYVQSIKISNAPMLIKMTKPVTLKKFVLQSKGKIILSCTLTNTHYLSSPHG